MQMSEYLFGEYKLLTNKYLAASQQLRELLPRFAKMTQTEKIPSNKTIKELLHELAAAGPHHPAQADFMDAGGR